MLPSPNRRKLLMILVILFLTPFISLDFLEALDNAGTISSGVQIGYSDGYLQFSNDYSFDGVNDATFDATDTVSGFASNQLVFTLANSSADTYPSFTLITGSTEPVYILNVLNYSYDTDRTTFYGQSSEQTVTVDFGNNYGDNKIIQSPTLTSAPTWSDNQFTFTATGSGTEVVKVAVPERPDYITIDGEAYDYGDKWTYASGVVTITDTFSTKTIMLSYEALSGEVGIPTAVPAEIAQFTDYLIEGDFLGFLVAAYVNAFTSSDIFWAFLICLFTTPLYVRTQSLTLLMILWVLIGGIFLVASPLLGGISVFLIVFAIAGLLFKLFLSVRR